jgi:hypothetical protein
MSTVRLWLDDIRPAPPGWVHARTATEAIAVLRAGSVVEVSLDHDLGDDPAAGDGYAVASWIEEMAAQGSLAPILHAVHSSNPAGRARMEAALRSADRFWAAIPLRPASDAG